MKSRRPSKTQCRVFCACANNNDAVSPALNQRIGSSNRSRNVPQLINDGNGASNFISSGRIVFKYRSSCRYCSRNLLIDIVTNVSTRRCLRLAAVIFK